MIGNDIVDLALAQKESNWKRNGFLNKLFTSDEQLMIHSSINPEIMVWNLWSRKEAVYKIFNRTTGIRKFNPIQLECLDDGKVIFDDQVYFTKTTITSEFIYSEAVLNSNDFNKIQGISRPSVIIKEDGIPYYLESSDSIKKQLSITHHGRFERIITLI
ncbi:4'-phosphopantetheinyl transferase superfamily protein [Flavobacterium sp.]|uniref:4'-phosphopantetheinyl transferase family protein n=1 Tax=Flavobacterium sp. TaxID=239 RepID=UPI002B4B0B75|nr:4'-phosphopantetheinyl transferase superfamily protein [Flavobacterium sp.]HLP65230.1 4'-phosphopantetheinyl transferase superfamily protein [Flavobacterium sp.]